MFCDFFGGTTVGDLLWMEETLRPIEIVLEKLTGAEKNGKGWRALCPAHPDRTPSLHVTEAVDGKVLVKCFAGCSARQIVNAIGLPMSALFPERPESETKGKKKRYPVLPPGPHLCRVFSSRIEGGPESGYSINLQLIAVAGAQKGVRVFDHFKISSSEDLSRLKGFLGAVGIQAREDVNLEPEQIAGRLLVVSTTTVDVVAGEDGEKKHRVNFGGYSIPPEGMITTYPYRDEAGELLFEVLRLVPKEFRQRRPNGRGGWTWDLEGTRRVLYRLPELRAASRAMTVFLVEGEKDVATVEDLGCLATTAPQGASGWGKLDKTCLEVLRGQRVVVVPDADQAGVEYLAAAAKDLAGVADSVGVLDVRALPLPEGTVAAVKDVSDWRAAWITAGVDPPSLPEVAARIALTPEGYLATVAPTLPGGKGPASMPARPQITNYREEEIETPEGVKKAKLAIPITAIVQDVLCICGGWPKRIGRELFFDNAGAIEILPGDPEFLAFVLARAELVWAGGVDAEGVCLTTKPEVRAGVVHSCEQVDDVSEFPLFPEPAGIYITSRFTKSERTDGSCLTDFLKRFRPATEADEALIWALALTPFWGGPPGERPLIVITGPEGQGVQETGKSTLADLVGLVAGGAFRVRLGRGDFGEDVAKQILGDAAIRYRVMLFDNLSGLTESAELADLITAPVIHGRPAYGRQRARANRLTWTATSVSPEFDEDLSSRCVVIHLLAPANGADPEFRAVGAAFVMENHARLISDALSILGGEKRFISERYSRFPLWDREVLGCHEAANEALKVRGERVRACDSRSEDVAILGSHLKAKHPIGTTELTPSALAEAWNESTGRKTSSSWVCRRIRMAIRAGKIGPWLQAKWASGTKGSPWIFDPHELPTH